MEYTSQKVAVAGSTGSAHGCDDFAIDGFMITGTALAYEWATKVFTVNGTTAPVAADSFTPPSAQFAATGSQTTGYNAGVITKIITDPNTDDVVFVLTSDEFFSDSYLVGLTTTNWVTETS